MSSRSSAAAVPHPDPMTPQERRAGLSLAAIFALRMLGLFIILPVFALHARSLPGGDNLTLVGLAIGAYGLTQAFLQIPFGMASDRYGRKPVIIAGLLLFIAGSVIAALADSVWGVMLGRAVQGAGAISAAVSALAADLTREQHRTKIMAMIGSTIALVFAGSLVAAPLLYDLIGMNGIFWLVSVMAGLAIVLLKFRVPDPEKVMAKPVRFAQVLKDPQLLRLNLGIFTLHLVQMAMFVVVPQLLVADGGLAVREHWQVYLPVVLGSFVLMVPAVIMAERRQKMKPVFLSAVALVAVSQFVLGWVSDQLYGVVACLFLFFVAFNVLEATLPSLVSRFAPPPAKGAALGVYNTTQSVGLFLGGLLGGGLAQHFGQASVFVATGGLALIWLLVASQMRSPPQVALLEYPQPAGWRMDELREVLVDLPGVREVWCDPARGRVRLKVYGEEWDEARFNDLIGQRKE